MRKRAIAEGEEKIVGSWQLAVEEEESWQWAVGKEEKC